MAIYVDLNYPMLKNRVGLKMFDLNDQPHPLTHDQKHVLMIQTAFSVLRHYCSPVRSYCLNCLNFANVETTRLFLNITIISFISKKVFYRLRFDYNYFDITYSQAGCHEMYLMVPLNISVPRVPGIVIFNQYIFISLYSGAAIFYSQLAPKLINVICLETWCERFYLLCLCT